MENVKEKLSVLIPCYNEESTIIEILKKIVNLCDSTGDALFLNFELEIIIVDDGSTDGSAERVRTYLQQHGEKNPKILLVQKANGGKGSAIKFAFEKSSGSIVIIQDADLEYDPLDYKIILEPFINQNAQVVYGSRRLRTENLQYSHLSFLIGGILITKITNLLYCSNLTDEPTCYKAFRRDVFKRFKPIADGFEWEPEITAKVLKSGITIYEVPIHYYPRHKNEGKKIKAIDGAKAIWTLLKHRCCNRF